MCCTSELNPRLLLMEDKLKFIYRIHAIERMFERDISEQDIESVVFNGEVIKNYPNDKPYPSRLSLGLLWSNRTGHLNNDSVN